MEMAVNLLCCIVLFQSMGIGMNPVFLMLPTTVACSYALMMPVSNPPNAIVFNACNMATTDMVSSDMATADMESTE